MREGNRLQYLKAVHRQPEGARLPQGLRKIRSLAGLSATEP